MNEHFLAGRRSLCRLAAAAFLVLPWLAAPAAWAQPFDHAYPAWDALLKKHVRWLADGKQSRVDYAGFKADHDALRQVLKGWSAVGAAEFESWSKRQQMAFFINAYNGFTIDLVLTRYPDLKSIKDLGGVFQSPWKKTFFNLLGHERHLDWIEHEQLRPRYEDPRIHAAIVCASIGCPALRDEAFTPARLEVQLEDSLRRFLGDRSRNRVRGGKLQVSPIFKWFRQDFEQGHLGFTRVEDVFARYADLVTDEPAERERLRARQLPVSYLDYDWSLNDAR
jgi:hypothetical protein